MKTIRSASVATLISLISTIQAQAATLLDPSCDTAGDSFKCRLAGILKFLDVAAGILGLVLVAVIFLAVRMYRNNQSEKNSPNE